MDNVPFPTRTLLLDPPIAPSETKSDFAIASVPSGPPTISVQINPTAASDPASSSAITSDPASSSTISSDPTSAHTGFIVPSVCAAIGGLLVGSIVMWVCLRVKRRGQRNVDGEASVPLPSPLSTTFPSPPDTFRAYDHASSTDTLQHTSSDLKSEPLEDQSEAPRSPNEMVAQSQIADTHANLTLAAVDSRRSTLSTSTLNSSMPPSYHSRASTTSVINHAT